MQKTNEYRMTLKELIHQVDRFLRSILGPPATLPPVPRSLATRAHGVDEQNSSGSDLSVSSGYVYLGAQSRHTALLVRAGFGPRKRIWVLDYLQGNQDRPAAPNIVASPKELFALACSLLWMCGQATLEQARVYRRVLWCPSKR